MDLVLKLLKKKLIDKKILDGKDGKPGEDGIPGQGFKIIKYIFSLKTH